jgi:glycosyltransferase involved in cell wall biosynthesis
MRSNGMRVAIVTETYPPEINGVALTVAGLANGLQNNGHEVQLIRPRQPDVAADPNRDDILVSSMRLPRYPGLRIGLPARRRLHALWKNRLPDALYVATEGPLGHSALGVAHRLGIPACTGFHTRFDEFVRYYGFGFLTPLVMRYLRGFHRRSAATLVPTAELMDFLKKQGFGNVELLRRAVDTRLFSPARRDDDLRAQWNLRADQLAVIHVGRIAAEKNLDLAVRAFRAIQSYRPDAKFIWVGDGPTRAVLQTQNPDFIFCGMQKGEALARHYASGDLFLFPSITETFGNVTLEALASGVPLVAFDYGAAREHLREGSGRGVPFADADTFIAAACELARDDAGRDAMRHAARAAVATLDPQTVCTTFAGLLGDIAKRRAA